MIDTHAHIAMEGYEGGTPAVLARAVAAGVRHVICVGAGGDLAEAESALAAARQHPGVSAICGIHPHDAEDWDETLWLQISQLCQAPEVVAIGETGFDFHYHHSTPVEQEAVFREHVRLARALHKPLCIHTRNAEPETLRVLREENAAEVGGVIHCFSGTRRFALEALDLGFHLSIPGIVTFRKPGELVEVLAATPLDRLLVETDSPFLAPMPHRGERNEPRFVRETLTKVAELKGLSFELAQAATTANAIRLFGERLRVELVDPLT
jgi:TatD DNase family protein